jgi:hypothetical protein
MSPAAEYQQVADYQKLVREYNVRNDQYDKLLQVYEKGAAEGRPDPDLKKALDDEYEKIHVLFAQVTEQRRKLEAVQEAALA